jgi:hypothetical protein
MANTPSGGGFKGIRPASATVRKSPTYVRRLALDGLIRSFQPPDGGPRLYSVDDLVAIVNQKDQLLANA